MTPASTSGSRVKSCSNCLEWWYMISGPGIKMEKLKKKLKIRCWHDEKWENSIFLGHLVGSTRVAKFIDGDAISCFELNHPCQLWELSPVQTPASFTRAIGKIWDKFCIFKHNVSSETCIFSNKMDVASFHGKVSLQIGRNRRLSQASSYFINSAQKCRLHEWFLNIIQKNIAAKKRRT